VADRVKKIRIEVTDNYSKGINNYVNALDKAENATAKFGKTANSGGGMSGFASSVTGAAQNLFFMGNAAMMAFKGVEGIVNQASQMAQMGFNAERSELAFEKMAGGAQEAEKWVSALKDATKGAITEADASAQAYQLMRFGLADTAEEAGKFARTVAIISAANPKLGGTSEAISQIQLTLSNMSYMRLDQLGISAGGVRARVAELKAEIAGISTEEAFKTAVMEELDKQANILGDDLLKVGNNTAQLGTRFSELKTDVGKVIGEGFEYAADKILDAADAVAILTDALSGKNAQLYTTPGAFADQAGGLRQMVEMYSPYNAQYMYGTGRDTAAETAAVRRALGLPVYTPQEWAELRVQQQVEIDAFARMYDNMINGPSSRSQAAIETTLGLSLEELPAWISHYQTLPGIKANQDAIDAMMTRWEEGFNYAERQSTAQYKAGLYGPGSMGLWQEAMGAATSAMLPQVHFGIDPASVEATRRALADAVTLDADAMRRVGRSVEGSITGSGARAAFSNELVQGAKDAGPTLATALSLDDLTGVSPRGVDTDIFSTVIGMLQEFEVEQETALDLQAQLELSLGQTTPGMELFTGLLETQTQRLADGEIDAQTYMDQLARVSGLDFSHINDLFAPLMNAGNYQGVIALLDKLEQFANPTYAGLAADYALSGELATGRRTGGAELGQGMEQAAPGIARGHVPSWLTDTIDTISNITDVLSAAQDEWPTYIAAFQAESSRYIETFSTDSQTQIGYLDAALMAMDGKIIHIEFDYSTAGGIYIPINPGENGTALDRPYNIPVGGRDAQTTPQAVVGKGINRPTGFAAGGAFRAGQLIEMNEPMGLMPELMTVGGHTFGVGGSAGGAVQPAGGGATRGNTYISVMLDTKEIAQTVARKMKVNPSTGALVVV
jgi:hypothetical protein